ncbi:hypothetical protein [Arthrobacter sp. NPDC058192]|uniref:hypothetical protein n=1 Tax=Arthrobacter sp. NPDC058192 TaxID=3346372 RepID=UPI0036EAB05F
MFNLDYLVDYYVGRRPGPREYRKPWRVTVDGETRGKYRTHARAVAKAAKIARTAKK